MPFWELLSHIVLWVLVGSSVLALLIAGCLFAICNQKNKNQKNYINEQLKRIREENQNPRSKTE